MLYPGQEIELYYRRKVLSLAQEISKSKKIYLDTKFWINLRDYVLGRSRVKIIKEIYNLIAELCRKSIIICPTSQYIFFELMKQNDLTTRNATAKLIDEFSKGVVTSEEETRIATEIKHYFDQKMYAANQVYPLNSLVWTKTIYLFGAVDPYNNNLTYSENLEIQKAFIDEIWVYKYQQVLDFLNQKNFPLPDDIRLIEAFNYEKQNNPVENISFKDLSHIEFKAILNFYKDNFKSLLEYNNVVYRNNFILLNDSTRLSSTNEIIEFIVNQKNNGIASIELPFFKIRSGILTAIRLEPNRKFKLTDFKDFGHASVALPYFDYFFTDKSLMHLLCKKPLQYDQKYACKIHSTFDSVLECLNSIKEEI